MAKFYLSCYGSEEFADSQLQKAGYSRANGSQLVALLRIDTAPELLVSALSTLFRMEEPPPEALEPARALVMSGAKSSVRNYAIALVDKLSKEKGMDLYLEAITDRRLTEKWFATRALTRYGDERALPGLLKHFGKVGVCGDESLDHSLPEDKERIWMIKWLHDYRDRPEVRAKFDRLIVNWDLITEGETDWMYANLEYFHRPDLRPRHLPEEN